MTHFVVVDSRTGEAVYSSTNYAEANEVASRNPNYIVTQHPGPGEIRV